METSGASMKRPRWIWIALVAMAAGAFTVFLLALGSRGSEIAGVLSLVVALLTAAPTLVALWRGAAAGAPRKPRRHVVIIAVAAVVGVGTAGLYWFAGGQADLNVTGDTGMTQSTGLRDGTRVQLVGRGSDGKPSPFAPPRRSHLAVKFTLVNPKATGYCVGPATVAFVVAVDSEPPNFARPVVVARSGDEVNLDLSTATRSAAVHAALSIPDPECRVELRLDRVLLYN